MKLLKPAWVSHDGHPIFSVDIHPDGSRFATGGQGEDCGRVVVWNMAPVISEEADSDENVPKLLCQMDNHLACVNCVRWSVSGRYLASAGDDKAILVWQCAGGGASVFGAGGAESWRCVATLRAHSGDVLDLAWAPHDAWLASCSVDNTVIVWSALNMPEVTAVLKGHTGLVKGVTWDPVGKFLASQSDDKSVRIWRTSDWREEALITEPFEECGGTTHVLRPSWSPDGLYLVSAHAMNGGGPTAQIIEREGWTTDKDFVGHRKAVTCVRFNSNILLKAMPHSTKNQQYCCAAIGSRDRSLSVWITALKRPLVVVKELFSSSVLDISWSVGGLQLMACSWDGTIAYIEFSEAEIGKPLSPTEKKSIHERMYGKSLVAPNTLASSTLVETPELLSLRQAQHLQSPVKPTASRNAPTTKPATTSSPMKGPIDKQIETRTSDGKRRITPMFIPPTPDNGEAPLPFGSSSQPTFSSSSETRSRIVIERRDEVVIPKVSQHSAPRRVEGEGKQLANGLSSSSVEEARPLPESVKEKSQTSSDTTVKRPAESRGVGRPAKRGRPTVVERERERVVVPSVQQAPPSPAVARTVGEELRLPALTIEKTFSVQVMGCAGKVFEVENCSLASPYGPLHKVKCHFRDKKPTHAQGSDWEAVLGSKAVALSANSTLSLVACDDRTLHVFETLHGRRPLPPLQLRARPHRLLASRQHVMVLSTQGRVSVWDVAAKKALVSEQSVAPLLGESSATILNCLVTEAGSPTVTLSSGKAFVFSPQLSAWLLLGDGRDPVQQTSGHLLYATSASQSGVSSVPAPPLCALQAVTKPASRGSSLGSASSSACTLTFLEQQLASSRALDSPRDYHLWLAAFTRFLVHEGLESRLRLLCDELLGPAHARASLSHTWDDKVMGMSKHMLLRETLTVMASNLGLQRLYSEYNDQLEELSTNQIAAPVPSANQKAPSTSSASHSIATTLKTSTPSTSTSSANQNIASTSTANQHVEKTAPSATSESQKSNQDTIKLVTNKSIVKPTVTNQNADSKKAEVLTNQESLKPTVGVKLTNQDEPKSSSTNQEVTKPVVEAETHIEIDKAAPTKSQKPEV